MTKRMSWLTEAEIRLRLMLEADAAPTRAEFAEALGVTPSTISMMINGRRPVSETVARALGFKRQFIYIPIQEVNDDE